MTRIKNEFLKYEYRDEEYVKRFSIDSNIDFLYKVYKNNKIEELTLMENFNKMIYLIHNDEYKYTL